MVGVVRLWNNWEVQILVVVSFLLQVFLLMFAGRRRRNISVVPRTLLWLAYMLADSTALYILGHLSISSSKLSSEHGQLMALCAPCLLVHLGGQDTITAYSIEDSRLWVRHLLSMQVHVMGVAYVVFQFSTARASSSTLVTAAAMLMFVAGVVKYGERVRALQSSRLDDNRWFLDRTEKCRVLEARRAQGGPVSYLQWVEENRLGSEEVLQGAHDLFPIFFGQFVGYKFWPSPLQSKAIKIFCEKKGRLYELIEMQLSLMYDILYTKAAVIHTRCGCLFRAVSMLATITAFFLMFMFLSSTSGENNFESRVDVIVTYILLAGAILLEITTALQAMCSTWTCALLRARRWDRPHRIALSLRRWVNAAEISRRWSGSIGQHKFLDLSDLIVGPKPQLGLGSSWTLFRGSIAELFGCKSSTVISESTKQLVLGEVFRMVEASEGREQVMGTCNGLKPFFLDHDDYLTLITIGRIDFDEKVLIWHSATEIFFSSSSCVQSGQHHALVEAIRALSRYMIWLLVERPYMLPNPVRPTLYAKTEAKYLEFGSYGVKLLMERELGMEVLKSKAPPSLVRGAQLAQKLRDTEDSMVEAAELMQVLLAVWVEMLCYAAHRCSRHSHARQLNSGIEFISIVWLLQSTIFNCFYCEDTWFHEVVDNFFKPARHHQEDIILYAP
uniref:Uncharacterized protein n=1 Tax=Avena sativa TaxID=4498 RepID=A0ACD5YC96_AVESA